MKQKRILIFVVNVDWFFLSHRLPIAICALAEGYEVHLATGLTDRRKEIEAYGIKVHPLTLERGGVGAMNALATFSQLLRIFSDLKPDVAHLVTIKPVLLGGIAARLVGVRSVVSAISGMGSVFISRDRYSGIKRIFVKLIYRYALGHRNLKVVVQNLDDLEKISEISGISPKKIYLINGSGVDLRRYSVSPLPAGSPVVMLASRMLGDKGVHEFVAAARLSRDAGLDARFVLVGPLDIANPSAITERQINDWTMEGVVEWRGARDDMQAEISTATLVVLPSYREGFPKVLIEAAACARAIVTTDVSGCRDAIESEVTGVLVPARDAVSLYEAIRKIVCDPALCVAYGIAGRERAERLFSIENVVADHLRIYMELAGS